MEVLKLTIQFMMMSDSPVIRRSMLRHTTSHSQTSTQRSALAGYPTAHHVQAESAGVQVFTWLCTAVWSCRAMCTGRRRHGAPQSARILATNHFNRTFQALSKNVFIRADIALSALATFLFNGLYL